ncbi:MAG: Gfo/Idh/MocA family oxidoreductase [Acidobacteria bacterium]|nr:Gfo/Idh/MocA family oxidoreductase [Acidobacteriota bacterium]
MKRNWRVAVVGLGSIGRRHVRLLCERDDCTVELVDTSPAAREAARGVFANLREHETFEAMIETRPHVVWIATPTPLHACQSIAALDAGCHVFCEKPMSDRLDTARLMKQAADRASTVLNIGFYLHFWHGMVRIRQLIQSGALGNVLHAHARVGSYTTLVNSASRYQATQRGSLFFDYSHQPDLFYWLLGKPPASVWVAGLQGGALELTSAPNVTDTICEYGGGLITSVHLNYVQLPERHIYEIVGDRGWTEADFFGSWIRIGSRPDGSVRTETFIQERDDIFRAEHAAFFEAIEGRRAPETSAADGLVSTAICEAAMQSWQTGRRVALAL